VRHELAGVHHYRRARRWRGYHRQARFGRTQGRQKQLTWNSKPLYFYNKDTKPGDVLGQNVGTVWFVVTNP